MKQFHMRNEGFICEHCGAFIEKADKTARDHCPKCLYSKHVDVLPGDRSNTCLGLLEPIDVEKFKNTYKIIYKCEKCGQLHKNIIASDDDMDVIIHLSSKK